MPTRIWELFAGSILAYLERIIGSRSKNKVLNLILPNIGLILIIHSIFFFNLNIPHPSFYTISPIIGVALIIWFSNEDNFTTKILSSKIFVGTGLISYSLYIWHYPIFAFARIENIFNDSLMTKLLIILIVIILSIISYYLIEKPARSEKLNFKKIFAIILLSSIIIIGFGIYSINKNGELSKINTFIEKKILSPKFSAKCKFSLLILIF